MYLHLGSCMGHPSKYISITKPSYFAVSFNTILKCTYFLKVLQRSWVQMLRFASKLLCDMVWGLNERQTCEPIHASFLPVETHLIGGWHTLKNLVILIQCPEVMEALCTSTSFHADSFQCHHNLDHLRKTEVEQEVKVRLSTYDHISVSCVLFICPLWKISAYEEEKSTHL